MSLIEMNWKPSDRNIRQFGLVNVVALPLIAWVWNSGIDVILWCVAIGAMLAILSIVVPIAVRPLYLLISCVAYPIGRVVSELSLLFMYYIVLVPIGMFFRLTGRDALSRKIERDADTYWHTRTEQPTARSYFHQY